MSQWTDRIQNHGVWQQMKDLGAAIDNGAAREGASVAAIEGLERLRAVLTFAGRRLAGADPQLLSNSPLDALLGALKDATTAAQTFASDGDDARIVSANVSADTVLAILPTINYPFVADDITVLRDSGQHYRETIETNLEQIHGSFSAIRVEADALKGQLSTLAISLENERARLASVEEQFQSQFRSGQETRTKESEVQIHASLNKIQIESAGLQQRLTELGTEISTERGRLTSAASEFQSQFSTAQESRNREFSDTQTNRQNQFATLVADYNQRLTDQNAEFTKQREEAFQGFEKNVAALNEKYNESAKSILGEIENHKSQVEKLVGVIGNLGVTSGFLTSANLARRMSWLWQGVTVSAMCFLIWIAYKAFLPVVQGTFNWEGFAGRVFVSLTVGVLAGYAASLADKYSATENRNRKLALELEAIGPFLAPLPPEKQEAFRLHLGERSFGGDDVNAYSKAGKSPATIVDLIKSKELKEFVVDLVEAVVKKAK